MSVSLLPLVMAVYISELCLTLPVLPWHSMVAARCQEPLNVISVGASSIPPLQRICRCLPNDLGKALAHSFSVTFANRGRQAILPSTFRFMTSARIASPCFTRLRFELRLSSRAPQVSAKRVRQSCSIKSRTLRSSVTMYSMLARPRLTSRYRWPSCLILDGSATDSLADASSSWLNLLLSSPHPLLQ